MEEVVSGVHRIVHRNANMYLLDHGSELALIDAGFPGSEGPVRAALAALGRAPADLADLILTHAHHDHVGSAAALVAATGATVWMHPLDAALTEVGRASRPAAPAPGLLGAILFRLYAQPGRTVTPVKVDRLVDDGDIIPVAGGLAVVHVPGHCAGQIALLHRATGVLFAADVGMNVVGLGDPIGFEDRALGRASQRKLAELNFRIACFGHGKPVDAIRLKRQWGG